MKRTSFFNTRHHVWFSPGILPRDSDGQSFSSSDVAAVCIQVCRLPPAPAAAGASQLLCRRLGFAAVCSSRRSRGRHSPQRRRRRWREARAAEGWQPMRIGGAICLSISHARGWGMPQFALPSAAAAAGSAPPPGAAAAGRGARSGRNSRPPRRGRRHGRRHPPSVVLAGSPPTAGPPRPAGPQRPAAAALMAARQGPRQGSP